MKKILKAAVVKILQSQTRRLLKKHQPLIIAITGSFGKTSTKLAIAHVLNDSYRVLAHPGNYNSETGLPLALFNQASPISSGIGSWYRILINNERLIHSDFPYDVVVLEMGADHPGDIKNFMSYITPDIGIVTAAAAVHTDNFGSTKAVLAEKWLLAMSSKFVIANRDDDGIRKKIEQLQVEHVAYGINEGEAHVKNLEFKVDTQSYEGKVVLPDKKLNVQFPVVGKHSIYALLIATIVANRLGIETEVIARRIKAWQQPAGRMSVLSGINESILIDDTYNSSPSAAMAAIKTLQMLVASRHLAVLGSMNELGDLEKESHEQVGAQCGQLDLLVVIGKAAKDYLLPAAFKAGLPSDKGYGFDDPYKAAEFLKEKISKGDMVLIKGSQNLVYAEEVTKALLQNEADRVKLVRQSQAWLTKKEEQFNE